MRYPLRIVWNLQHQLQQQELINKYGVIPARIQSSEQIQTQLQDMEMKGATHRENNHTM